MALGLLYRLEYIFLLREKNLRNFLKSSIYKRNIVPSLNGKTYKRNIVQVSKMKVIYYKNKIIAVQMPKIDEKIYFKGGDKC